MHITVETEGIERLISLAVGTSIILAIGIYITLRYLRNRTIDGIFDQIREDLT